VFVDTGRQVDSTSAVTSILETNLSQEARLNTVVKKLTGWAAVIVVPTAVTGWLGQSVAYPGFGRTSGLLASTIVIAVLAGTLYIMFRGATGSESPDPLTPRLR
jgi:magnesium transporter